MTDLLPILDWQPVILLKVNREPFSHKPNTLTLNRLYLALHPDGVVCAGWYTPPSQRNVPQIRLVGWKPERDVPFTLPVRFERKGDRRVSALIPNGTWVLSYEEIQYQRFRELQRTLTMLLTSIDSAPYSQITQEFIRSIVSPTHFLSLN